MVGLIQKTPDWNGSSYAIENDGYIADYECNDGIDNDEDGAIDIADISCYFSISDI